jgi:hypothetical protein
MKKVALVALVLFWLSLALVNTGTAQSGMLQQCGQGVIIRADSTLMVDKWTAWGTQANDEASPRPLPPGPVPLAVKQIAAPVRIILGATLEDPTPVWLETKDGTMVVTLGAIRTQANKARASR